MLGESQKGTRRIACSLVVVRCRGTYPDKLGGAIDEALLLVMAKFVFVRRPIPHALPNALLVALAVHAPEDVAHRLDLAR